MRAYFGDQGHRKCVPRTSAHWIIAFSKFTAGKPGPEHLVVTREIAYRYIRARTLQVSSLPWRRGQHIQSEATGKYPMASCDRPTYMNRCSLWKDVRRILAQTRPLIIKILISNCAPRCYQVELMFACPPCASSNYLVRSGTPSSPFQTRRYYLYYMTASGPILFTSFTWFDHNRSFTQFTIYHTSISSYSLPCWSSSYSPPTPTP